MLIEKDTEGKAVGTNIRNQLVNIKFLYRFYRFMYVGEADSKPKIPSPPRHAKENEERKYRKFIEPVSSVGCVLSCTESDYVKKKTYNQSIT